MKKTGKFLLGAGIGVGLGMLFAPKSGDETRKALKKKTGELATKIKNMDKDEVKANISNKIDELQAELASLDKEKVMAIAKTKAEDIKKRADELVKMAIEKGMPAAEKAAREVRSATADFLKNVANKIDAPEVKKQGPKKTNKDAK